MRAFILAAGRGERLKPLTDKTPKPLIMAGKYSLIEYHLRNLQQAGVSDIVINTAWLGDMIRQTIGDGSKYQMSITYSDEGDKALETAGGIINALPLLGDDPFIVVNADIWSEYDLANLTRHSMDTEAHLVLVDNPKHNDVGDFSLNDNMLTHSGNQKLTYSGMGIYTKSFFHGSPAGPLPLAPILRSKIDQRLVSGEHYRGLWTDVGTLERLDELNIALAKQAD